MSHCILQIIWNSLSAFPFSSVLILLFLHQYALDKNFTLQSYIKVGKQIIGQTIMKRLKMIFFHFFKGYECWAQKAQAGSFGMQTSTQQGWCHEVVPNQIWWYHSQQRKINYLLLSEVLSMIHGSNQDTIFDHVLK